MYDIVVSKGELLSLGGIETWLINLARRYGKTHKMAVVYRSADHRILGDIAKHCEVIRYEGQAIQSKRAVFCFDLFALESIDAPEKFYTVHADFREIKWNLVIPDGMKVLSVSEVARQGLMETKGIESEVAYNPVDVSSVKQLGRLVSGTRLSEEKGLKRMLMLDKALSSLGALYEWHIFTSHPSVEGFSDNVIIRKPTRDLLSYIARADYLVQLSNTESYGYSIVEALKLGTPVAVTDIPVLGELGIDSRHGVIIPLDATDYRQYAEQLIHNRYQFSYTPPTDRWDGVFGAGSGSDYRYAPILVESIYPQELALMDEGVTVNKGDRVEVLTRQRADFLEKGGYVQIVE